MASVSSLDKDLARLRRSKYTPEAAAAVGDWIASTLGEPLPRGDLMNVLKDGTVLCRLANHLGGKQIRFKTSAMPFVQMENIAQFLTTISSDPISLPPHDRFLTVDLYEKKDPAQVLQCLGAFSRVAHNLNPSAFRDTVGGLKAAVALGEKASGGMGGLKKEPNVNVKTSAWTKKEEEGNTAPAWNVAQYGYMGGASQGNQGITFGGRRQITATPPVAGGLSSAEKERRKRAEEVERERLRRQEEEERNEALRKREDENEARRRQAEAELAARQREEERLQKQRQGEERRRAQEQRHAEQRDKEELRRRERELEAEALRKEDALRKAAELRQQKEEELARLECQRRQEKLEHQRQKEENERQQEATATRKSRWAEEEERRTTWQRQRDHERSQEAELQRERERVRELERELAMARERERLYEAEKEVRRREETERMRRDAAEVIRHRTGERASVVAHRTGEKPRYVASHLTGDRSMPPPRHHIDRGRESAELEEERRFLQNSWARETMATPPITEPTDSRPSSIIPLRALPTPPPRKLPLPPPLRNKPSWEKGDDENPLDSPTKEEVAEAALNWSNMSFLERERERERQRQKEWERDQRESQKIAQRQLESVAASEDGDYGYAHDILDMY